MNKKSNENKNGFDVIAFCAAVGKFIKDCAVEIVRGFQTNTIPLLPLLLASSILGILCMKGYDLALLDLAVRKLGFDGINFGKWSRFLYLQSITIFPFFIWTCARINQRRKLTEKLTKAFTNAHLISPSGEFPQFVSDMAIDEWSRKLTLRTNGNPLSKFKAADEIIQEQLGVHVIDMKLQTNKNDIVEINYSQSMTPIFWYIDDISRYKNFSFPIGQRQNQEIVVSLIEVPHFLVAGMTGGGKSSFIRMMVAILKMNNEDLDVSVLDLKGGMESQVFKDIEGVKIFDNVKNCHGHLKSLSLKLDERMAKISAAGCKDILAYNKKLSENASKMSRHLIVVDEVSELSVKVNDTFKKELQEGREFLNRIARLGRASGIHLVVGTQKPDAKNLDTTIKANLSGIICFYVNNFVNSTVVLGNKRAAEISPHVRGRAIWQWGPLQEEVQTPHLTEDEAQQALEDYKYSKDNQRNSTYEEENTITR